MDDLPRMDLRQPLKADVKAPHPPQSPTPHRGRLSHRSAPPESPKETRQEADGQHLGGLERRAWL